MAKESKKPEEKKELPKEEKKQEEEESPEEEEKNVKLKKSEYKSNQFLDLHYKVIGKEALPCASADEKAINIKIQADEAIPEIFIPNFLLHNRNFISNVEYKDGKPFITEEQEKKYGIDFHGPAKGKPKEYAKYTAEKLMRRLGTFIKKHGKEEGEDKFKQWAEDTFGEDEIDRRKTARTIVYDIRKILG